MLKYIYFFILIFLRIFIFNHILKIKLKGAVIMARKHKNIDTFACPVEN